jgi:flagellar FliJ protein
MKAFEFRLQTKLDVSVREEQLAKEEMHLQIKRRDVVAEQLNNTLREIDNVEAMIKKLIKESFTMEKYMLLKDYIPVLKELQAKQEQELITAEESVEQARAVLMEKSRETKVLNKLKNKEWNLYLQELYREEQKIIDEIAITSHYRKTVDNLL